ncbi:hypothetical protein EJK15_40040 [Nonomuraea basaltis]|nr:hypothetical protein EJK15_40040 [Nonomuraea basaltis]
MKIVDGDTHVLETGQGKPIGRWVAHRSARAWLSGDRSNSMPTKDAEVKAAPEGTTLRLTGATNLAQAIRHLSRDATRPLALLGLT